MGPGIPTVPSGAFPVSISAPDCVHDYLMANSQVMETALPLQAMCAAEEVMFPLAHVLMSYAKHGLRGVGSSFQKTSKSVLFAANIRNVAIAYGHFGGSAG